MARAEAVFIINGPRSPFVFGPALIVTTGASINIIAAYFLVDNRLAERLYKIHLQAETSLDIISSVIRKFSLGSAFFAALAGVAPGYHLRGRLDISPASFLETMKRAGLDGDLAVTADAGMRNRPESGGVFN